MSSFHPLFVILADLERQLLAGAIVRILSASLPDKQNRFVGNDMVEGRGDEGRLSALILSPKKPDMLCKKLSSLTSGRESKEAQNKVTNEEREVRASRRPHLTGLKLRVCIYWT
jgi:hypothetical protein